LIDLQHRSLLKLKSIDASVAVGPPSGSSEMAGEFDERGLSSPVWRANPPYGCDAAHGDPRRSMFRQHADDIGFGPAAMMIASPVRQKLVRAPANRR
jgi:hypothetical protein